MKTDLQKEIQQGVADKLLLKDASIWAVAKHVHANHKFQLVECFVVAGVLGVVLGSVL